MSETCNQPSRRGRPCWRQTGHPSGHCYQHRGGRPHPAALASARDEVVRAATEYAAVSPSDVDAYVRGDARLRAAVAALAKLEGK